jgi:rhodanese-related sulfurtransferase
MAISEITVDELDDRLAEGARLIDVRLPYEFEEAHVAGAVLVPLPTVADNVDAFRGDEPVYVICRTGPRSLRACEFLAAQGVEAVNVAGGTLAWISSGRDYVSGNDVSGNDISGNE